MTTELTVYRPEVKGNELEEYADKVADSVFVPLAEFDMLFLESLQPYPQAYEATARFLIERWADPPEEDEVKKPKSKVQVFPNPRYERKP